MKPTKEQREKIKEVFGIDVENEIPDKRFNLLMSVIKHVKRKHLKKKPDKRIKNRIRNEDGE